MQIGELNRRIEVLDFIGKRDSFGGVVMEWQTASRVWAKIEPSKGSEQLASDQIKSKQPVKITVRFYAGLTIEHRLKYKDTIYEITGVVDENTGHRWTVIEAKERGNGEL